MCSNFPVLYHQLFHLGHAIFGFVLIILATVIFAIAHSTFGAVILFIGLGTMGSSVTAMLAVVRRSVFLLGLACIAFCVDLLLIGVITFGLTLFNDQVTNILQQFDNGDNSDIQNYLKNNGNAIGLGGLILVFAESITFILMAFCPRALIPPPDYDEFDNVHEIDYGRVNDVGDIKHTKTPITDQKRNELNAKYGNVFQKGKQYSPPGKNQTYDFENDDYEDEELV